MASKQFEEALKAYKQKGLVGSIQEKRPPKPQEIIEEPKPVETPPQVSFWDKVKNVARETPKYTVGLPFTLASKAIRQVSPKTSDFIDTYQNNVYNSVSLGAKDYLLGQSEEQKRLNESNKTAATLGNLAGYVMPGVAIEKGLVKAMPSVFKGLKPVTDIVAKGAISGGAMGAIEGGFQGIGEGMGVKGTLENMYNKGTEYGVMGGLGGAVIGGGMKGLPKAKDFVFGKGYNATREAFENAVKPMPKVIPPKPFEPKVTTGMDMPIQYQQKLPKLNEPLMLPEPSMYRVDPRFAKDIVRPPSLPQINSMKPTSQINPMKPQGNIKSPSTKIEPVKMANMTEELSGEIGVNKKVVNPDIETGRIKERKTISNSYMNSDVIPENMKAEMKGKIPTYPEISNEKTLKEAYKIIDSDFDGSVREFLSSEGLDGAIDTAKGIGLIQRAVAKGDTKLANDISISLAEKMTKAGQEVQAMSIMKRMTPEGMLQYANKVINKANKTLAEKGKDIIKLTDDEAKFIVDNMKDVQNAMEGNLKLIEIDLQKFGSIDDFIANKMGKIMKVINNKIPANLGEKLKSFQRINLLLNPKTMVRNITGNVIFAGARNTKDLLASGIDKAVGKFTGKRAVLPPDLKAQAKGFKKGWNRAINDYKEGINTSPTGTQYEIEGRSISPFEGKGKISKVLKKADEYTRTGLRLGDDPFYQATYEDVLSREMKLANATSPTDEMIKKADQIARESTFQDTNNITKAFSGLQRALNKIGTENFGLGNIVLPFVKTPSNILARALEYSPASLWNTTKQLVNAATKNGKFDQYEFVDSLAKSLTGTSLIGAGYLLAEKGYISGKSSKDADARRFNESIGILPYSFKLGDSSYTYDWAQPSAIPLAMGADIYYQLKDKPDATASNKLIEAGTSGLDTLFSQSLLTGMSKLFGGNNFSGTGFVDNLVNTGLSSTTQAIPFGSILRQTAEFKDTYDRSTYDDNLVRKLAINPIKNSIPGLRETLPHKINSFGEPVKSDNWFDTFINPARASQAGVKDSTVDELNRLNKQAGETMQFPVQPRAEISYKLGKRAPTEKYKLTPKELSEFTQTLAKTNLDKVQKIIKLPKYKGSNDKQKAKMISDAMSENKQRQETIFLKTMGIKEYKSRK